MVGKLEHQHNIQGANLEDHIRKQIIRNILYKQTYKENKYNKNTEFQG